MSRKVVAIVITGMITVAFALASSPAFSKEKPIKEIMADNFARMQRILVSLVTSNYKALPNDLDTIREHADRLPQMMPEEAKDNEATFLAYAYNLKTHADFLKETIDKLIEHDAQRYKGEQLRTDVLRDLAAAHYGGMIQMCVACHNRFRQHVVE